MAGLIAKTPRPPYFAVIFTSLRAAAENGYGETAAKMAALRDGLFAFGALVVTGVRFFSFIPKITIGHIWWHLGHFLPFSYRLEVLGVVLPHHYG